MSCSSRNGVTTVVGHTKPTANGGVTAVVTAKGAPVGIGTGAATATAVVTAAGTTAGIGTGAATATTVVTAKGAPVGIGTGAVTGAGITVGIVADIAAGIVAAVIADMGTATTPKGAGTHVTTHVTVIGSAAVFRGSITW